MVCVQQMMGNIAEGLFQVIAVQLPYVRVLMGEPDGRLGVQLPQPEDRYINLKLYEKNCQLCINMSNSYHTAPVFKNDIPTTSANGHGIGIQSMISVIEKYHGIYGFFAENGEFRFQASI